jgi:hypothetical protein
LKSLFHSEKANCVPHGAEWVDHLSNIRLGHELTLSQKRICQGILYNCLTSCSHDCSKMPYLSLATLTTCLTLGECKSSHSFNHGCLILSMDVKILKQERNVVKPTTTKTKAWQHLQRRTHHYSLYMPIHCQEKSALLWMVWYLW